MPRPVTSGKYAVPKEVDDLKPSDMDCFVKVVYTNSVNDLLTFHRIALLDCRALAMYNVSKKRKERPWGSNHLGRFNAPRPWYKYHAYCSRLHRN